MVEFNVKLNGKTILVTGAAGFIGANLVRRLYEMAEDITVIGLDSVNEYYDVSLKEYRPELRYEKGRLPSFPTSLC